MSAQSTHVGAVLTAIDTLGYSLSKENFDFDSVPGSIQDKAYRWGIETSGIRELSGMRVEKDKSLNVWLAYKLTAGGNRRAAVLAMLDSSEAVEDELLKTLSTIPSLVVSDVMSKYLQGYIVFNVGMTFTYWRDLT